MTAAHVIKQAEETRGADELIGLFTKQPDRPDKHQAAPVIKYEKAPLPYDIAVGLAGYCIDTPLRLMDVPVEIWREVATLGYPESALNRDGAALWLNLRGHRGYVQREIKPGKYGLNGHPECFELSFPITAGLSGSPLFIRQGTDDAVIGVCVGSHSSRIVAYSLEELDADGTKISEKHNRIEEFGIAHDLRSLLDWKIEIFHDLTLEHVSKLALPEFEGSMTPGTEEA